MKISRKLLLSHTIIIAFIFVVTVAFQKVTSEFGNEFAKLGNRSVDTVSLLKDLRFTGLRIITSTSEFLLIASLESQESGEHEAGGKQGSHREDIHGEAGHSEAHDQEGGHSEAAHREGAHGEDGHSEGAHGEEGHHHEHGEGHNNPDAARRHVGETIERYRETLTLFEESIAPDGAQLPAFEAKLREAGEALIAKSDTLLMTASSGFDPRQVLEHREQFEQLERVFLSAIETAMAAQKQIYAEEEQTIFSGIAVVSGASWLGFFAITAFVLTLGFVVTNAIGRPTQALAEGVRTVAGGDLSVRLDMKRSDEIGQVAAGFDSMVETLQEKDAMLNRRISDLNEAHERLARLNAELEQRTEQLTISMEQAEAANTAKTDFLANMSHELRTPLNAIIGFSEMISQETLGPVGNEEYRKYGRHIVDAGEQLLALVRDILDLTRIEADRVELEEVDFDITELLESLSPIVQAGDRDKNIAYTLDIAPEVTPVVKGDPTRIRQILFNLVGNAFKFTEEGSVKLVVTQETVGEEELLLRFTVTDTGIGIAPHVQPQLFTNFTQADTSITRKYGGTGLGLAISKRLAELMDGEIGFESVPGEGSTFWFTVRCAKGDPQSLVDESAGIEAALRGNSRPLRILVAEDDQVNQQVVNAILQHTPHQVDFVANGAEAVAAAKKEPYDLILMDVQMAEMDGVTATRQIRDLPGDAGKIPVVALTANAIVGDREKYLGAGMTDYLTKPIKPRKLLDAIARYSGPERKDVA